MGKRIIGAAGLLLSLVMMWGTGKERVAAANVYRADAAYDLEISQGEAGGTRYRRFKLPSVDEDSRTVLIFPSQTGTSDAYIVRFAEYFALRGQRAVICDFKPADYRVEEVTEAVRELFGKLPGNLQNPVILAEGESFSLLVTAYNRGAVAKTPTLLAGLNAVVDTNPASGYALSENLLGANAGDFNVQNEIARNMPQTVLFSSAEEDDGLFQSGAYPAVNRIESQIRYFRDVNKYGGDCRLYSYQGVGDFYAFSRQPDTYYDVLRRLDTLLTRAGVANDTGLRIETGTIPKVKEFDKPAVEKRVVTDCDGTYAVYRATDHGVTGNGVSNDSKAVADLFALAISNGGGTVLFPRGVYYIDRLIHIDAGTVNLTIAGEGQGVTVFQQENYDGVFCFDVRDGNSKIEWRDFSVFTSRTNCGTAIEYNLLADNARKQTCSMRNVEVRGSSVSKECYNYGFRMRNQYSPLYTNVLFAGPFGGGVSSNKDAAGSKLYKCQIAFDASGSRAPLFEYCYMWAAYTNFRLKHVKDAEGRGFQLYNCFGVEGRIGVDVDGGRDRSAAGVINGGHCNSRDFALRLRNVSDVRVANMLLYNEDIGDVAFAYTDIMIAGCKNVTVVNTVFHYNGHSGRVNIEVLDGSANINLVNNYFNARGNGVLVSDPTCTVFLLDNVFTESLTGYTWRGEFTQARGNVEF